MTSASHSLGALDSQRFGAMVSGAMSSATTLATTTLPPSDQTFPAPNPFADAVWRYIQAQLRTPTAQPSAHIPLTEIYHRMPEEDQQWLVSVFGHIMNSTAQWTVIEACDKAVLHIAGLSTMYGQVITLPSDESLARVATPPKGPKGAKSVVPRPPNAFILYRMDYHELTKSYHPGIKNNDISKILGRQWRAESQEIVEYYKGKAQRAKIEHFVMYPEYRYRPRRPEEKKRRMVKNKQRKLLENVQTEQLAVCMATNRIDPDILGDKDFRFVMDCTPETHSSIGGISLSMNDSMWNYSQFAIDETEKIIGSLTWDDFDAQASPMHNDDCTGDYVPHSGVIPGAYLLTQ